LIQGSACSDAAMGWLMKPVAEAVGGDIRVFGDDMIIPARTLRDARASENTLNSALKAHPAGELNAKYIRIVKRETGFTFVGYHLRRRRGKTTVAPSVRKLERTLLRFNEALFDDIGAGRVEPVETEKVLRQWRNGYSAWSIGDAWVERMLCRARRHLGTFNGTSPRRA